MPDIKYGLTRKLGKVGFADAVKRVEEALSHEGFGVLTEIDVKKTLKSKLDAEFRNYKIIGACNPKLAHEALHAEHHIGLLLPCNVVIQEFPDGEIVVSALDPRLMFSLVENPALQGVVDEADARIGRALDALGAPGS